MKEKIIFSLVVIVMAIYLIFGICKCHKQWQEGITSEEQIREDILIW